MPSPRVRKSGGEYEAAQPVSVRISPVRQLTIRGLSIFSDNDASIRVDLLLERLQAMRRAGHRYDYVLFSGLGHDNMDATFPETVPIGTDPRGSAQCGAQQPGGLHGCHTIADPVC